MTNTEAPVSVSSLLIALFDLVETDREVASCSPSAEAVFEELVSRDLVERVSSDHGESFRVTGDGRAMVSTLTRRRV